MIRTYIHTQAHLDTYMCIYIYIYMCERCQIESLPWRRSFFVSLTVSLRHPYGVRVKWQYDPVAF
jgi:hypothetical protein